MTSASDPGIRSVSSCFLSVLLFFSLHFFLSSFLCLFLLLPFFLFFSFSFSFFFFLFSLFFSHFVDALLFSPAVFQISLGKQKTRRNPRRKRRRSRPREDWSWMRRLTRKIKSTLLLHFFSLFFFLYPLFFFSLFVEATIIPLERDPMVLHRECRGRCPSPSRFPSFSFLLSSLHLCLLSLFCSTGVIKKEKGGP